MEIVILIIGLYFTIGLIAFAIVDKDDELYNEYQRIKGSLTAIWFLTFWWFVIYKYLTIKHEI